MFYTFNNNISYDDFCKNLNTGDILLYHSTGFFSKIIEYFTHSLYSHVAIILKNPSWLSNELTDDFYIIESGPESSPDSIDHKLKFGVQIYPLKKVFDEYYNGNAGNLYFRKLESNLPINELQDKIKNAYQLVKNKPYDLDPNDWITALLDLNKDVKDIKDSDRERNDCFWCSALVSFIYVQCGFLDKNLPWSLISPSDYCCYNNKQRLKFLNCSLENDKCIL